MATAHQVRSRIPIRPAIDPAYFEEERSRVFARTWLLAGRLDEFAKIGDYAVREFEMLGRSALIVRGRDKQLRAFHNICPHRGNKLAYAERGCSRAFTCNFHGWTFDDQGRLAHVPGEDNFADLDRATLGLIAIRIDCWQGFVFVNFDKDADGLHAYLGKVAERTEGYPLADMTCAATYTSIVKANWKTFQDAFMESYHVTVVHQRSLPDLRKEMIPRDIDFLGQHGNQTAYVNLKHEPLPTEQTVWKVSNGFMRSADGNNLPELPPLMNRRRQANWAFDQYCIFPNLLMMLGNGWVTVHQFWPVSVDETRWQASYLVLPSGGCMAQVANEFFKVRLRDTVREDLHTIEATHASQRSGVIDEMVLSQQEGLIAHHRDVLDRYMAAA